MSAGEEKIEGNENIQFGEDNRMAYMVFYFNLIRNRGVELVLLLRRLLLVWAWNTCTRSIPLPYLLDV